MGKHEILHWWFIRHAKIAEIDAYGNATKGKFIGQMDVTCDTPPTNALAWLVAQRPAYDRLIHSHLKRAQQTTEFLMAQGLTVGTQHIEPAFAEQNFGDWQGMDYNTHYQQYPEFWQNVTHNRPPNGESFADLQKNVVQAMQSYYQQYDTQHLLVVAHAGSIRAAIAACQHEDLTSALNYQIAHLSLTHLTMQQTTQGYELHAININMKENNDE